jgi:hypothetical protein
MKRILALFIVLLGFSTATMFAETTPVVQDQAVAANHAGHAKKHPKKHAKKKHGKKQAKKKQRKKHAKKAAA